MYPINFRVAMQDMVPPSNLLPELEENWHSHISEATDTQASQNSPPPSQDVFLLSSILCYSILPPALLLPTLLLPTMLLPTMLLPMWLPHWWSGLTFMLPWLMLPWLMLPRLMLFQPMLSQSMLWWLNTSTLPGPHQRSQRELHQPNPTIRSCDPATSLHRNRPGTSSRCHL
uniref:Uncharacterized protein n=1 Tax=Sphaerodactylus townsendi TaxID=933632 RepID=A0ACB8G705_9SAUR